MRNLLLVLLTSISIVVYGQNIYCDTSQVTSPNDTLTFLKKDMDLLNGILKIDDERIIGKFVDGRREGEHKEWYSSGELMYKGNYKGGKKVGLFKRWYKSGQLSIMSIDSSGKRMSEKKWNEKGQIYWSLKGFIDDQGRYSSIIFEYFQDYPERGKISREMRFTPTFKVHKLFSRGSASDRKDLYMYNSQWETWELVDSAGTSHKVNVNQHDTSWNAEGEIIYIKHNDIQVYTIEKVDDQSSEDINEEAEEIPYLNYVLMIIGLLILFIFLRKFYWKK